MRKSTKRNSAKKKKEFGSLPPDVVPAQEGGPGKTFPAVPVSDDPPDWKKSNKPEAVKRKKILFARAWVQLRSRRLAVDASGAQCSTDASKDSLAWEWLHDPEVVAEINRLEKILEKRAMMKAEELDGYVEALLQANPKELVDPETGEIKDLRDLPRELCYAIAEYTTETRIDRKTGEKVVSRKVKLHNKKESAELYYKRKKLLKDQVEHSGSVTLNHAERLADARKREEALLRKRKKEAS